MSLLRNLYDNFEEYAAAFFVAVMIFCLTLQVIMRITVGSSLAWTEELSRYSFLWAVYVGASLAAKRRAHVRITAQFLKMPTAFRIFFRVIADAIWVGGCLYVAWEGLLVIQESLDYPEVSPTLGIVKSWVEAVIPVSFVMVAWRVVEEYIVRLKNGTITDMVKYEEEAA